jgi:rubrerythrin
MAITFNADEIFDIAVQIEKNASSFYKEAAKITADDATKQMLSEFSAMEAGHAQEFAGMRQELSQIDKEPITFDPDEEAALYLKSFSEAHGWEGKSAKGIKLSGNETREEILRSALGAEKDSVAFYVGIRDIVFGKSGKEKVEKIIKEEMKHITAISSMLADLKS